MKKSFTKIFGSRSRRNTEIDPDEVMLDSSNLPNYNRHQLEGRLEKPISSLALYGIGSVLVIIFIIFVAQVWKLQIANGDTYRLRSERNMLRPAPIFAGRGVIYDRNGTLLAWNSPDEVASMKIVSDSDTSGPATNLFKLIDATSTATSTSDVASTSKLVISQRSDSFIGEETIARREYATSSGLAHMLGYVQYPSKDKNGFYYRTDFKGVGGAEQYFDAALQGTNGSRLVEVDAQGNIISQNIIEPPEQGNSVTLSIDSRVQSALYENIKDLATRIGFSGGAGVIMDIQTGEIIALTSYPEYSPQVMSDGTDSAKIKNYLSDKNLPFLDRAIDGLYTPGSIVKPYLALGALDLNIIHPSTVVPYSGSITVKNPYDETQTSTFKDWKDLGYLDMRHALGMSSDVYFYVVGGGYKGVKGLGILNIDKYFKLFGFGEAIAESFVSSKTGTIPTPEWKQKTFKEAWFLGDTYHTAIGQYGMQVTPVQVVRAVAAIANNGTLLVPTVIKGDTAHIERTIDIDTDHFRIVKEGMRFAVTDGINGVLNVPFTKVAGKSGTAELGESRQKINSWITGFWPYDKPRYAFAVTLEKGSVHNTIGATTAMRQQLDWMHEHTPEYFDVK